MSDDGGIIIGAVILIVTIVIGAAVWSAFHNTVDDVQESNPSETTDPLIDGYQVYFKATALIAAVGLILAFITAALGRR